MQSDDNCKQCEKEKKEKKGERKEIERGIERDKERDRETERQREKEKDRQTEKEGQRETEREKQREIDRKRKRVNYFLTNSQYKPIQLQVKYQHGIQIRAKTSMNKREKETVKMMQYEERTCLHMKQDR